MRHKNSTQAHELRKQCNASEGLLWRVLRYSDNDVAADVEAVCEAIARHLGQEYLFKKRSGGGSAKKSERRGGGGVSRRASGPSSKPRTSAATLPREGEDV